MKHQLRNQIKRGLVMNDLVKIEDSKVLTVFTTDKGLDPVLQKIKTMVDDFEHDLETEAGRKRTASLGHSVARSKTYLDALGKDLVTDWKNKAKVVDSERKRMRDQLDDLKSVALEPLTKWKAEQEELARIAAKKAAAEKLQKEIDDLYDYAVLLNEQFDRERLEAADKAKAEAERVELERLQREKQIAIKAAAKAKAEAAQEALELAKKVEAEKKANELAIEQAKIQKIAAEERAKVLAEQAEQREKQAAEQARIDEISRQQAEEARIKSESEAREANKKHVGSIRKAAKEALMSECGLDEKLAKEVVMAINSNLIPNVSIQY